MARGKDPVALRMDPALRAHAKSKAKLDRRSFAGYLEWLVSEDMKRRPLPDQLENGQSEDGDLHVEPRG